MSAGCAKPLAHDPGNERTAERAAAPAPGAADDPAAPATAGMSQEPAAAGETCLGVEDHGIWSDLDDDVQLSLPADLDPARVTARIDAARKLLILAVDGIPAKPYPLSGDAALDVGDRHLAVRPGDRAELARLLSPDRIAEGVAADDQDHDGLPDALDVLIGAKKTVANADAYGAGYISISYPGGDVPREVGVCTDVIIRAMRNAGVDLQAELHRDVARARRAYPMVKGNGDTNIDHRRVRTILPWFLRHWDAHTIDLDDTSDPLRPGDVVFMDTFPSKAGPDHIGIVSDRLGDSGHPLIINNWTDGYVTSEMDLLGFVPITHRFRIR